MKLLKHYKIPNQSTKVANKENSLYDFEVPKIEFDIEKARLHVNKEIVTLLSPKFGIPFDISQN